MRTQALLRGILLSRRVSSMASPTRAAVVRAGCLFFGVSGQLTLHRWTGYRWFFGSEGCPVASVGAAACCRLLSGSVEGNAAVDLRRGPSLIVLLVSYMPLDAIDATDKNFALNPA